MAHVTVMGGECAGKGSRISSNCYVLSQVSKLLGMCGGSKGVPRPKFFHFYAVFGKKFAK